MLYNTGHQDVITIDKPKALIACNFTGLVVMLVMVDVMQRLIQENGKVHFDMIYPTGYHDMITNDKPKETFRLILIISVVKATEAKSFASTNKSDKTVKDLIWLLETTFDLHFC